MARLGDTIVNHIILLVADNYAGPYSIIDGNHRAIALWRHYLEHPLAPDGRGMLTVDPTMRASPWHRGPYVS